MIYNSKNPIHNIKDINFILKTRNWPDWSWQVIDRFARFVTSHKNLTCQPDRGNPGSKTFSTV